MEALQHLPTEAGALFYGRSFCAKRQEGCGAGDSVFKRRAHGGGEVEGCELKIHIKNDGL